MENNLAEKIGVLIIEDSEDCAALLSHILLGAKIFGPVSILKTGEEGMAYLEGKSGEQGKDFLPGIIFLDLNLPGEHGLETLGKIKKYSESHLIPVIVMTASEDRKDLLESYRKGGTFFIHKPIEKNALIEVLMHMKTIGVLNRKNDKK